MEKHKHKVEKESTQPFFGCVSVSKCDPRSHGGITEVQSCACGATRKINRNQFFKETGKWVERTE